MPAVFISYSHTDASLAHELEALLEQLDIECFLDVKDINWGDNITTRVGVALRQCRAVIVILSPGSLKSEWVPYEIGQASALGKRILPLVTQTSLDIPAYIRGLSYVTSIKQAKEYVQKLGSELDAPTDTLFATPRSHVPAGTIVRNSPYKFANVIDDQCKIIIITGHNFADLLGTRPNPPSDFHQLIVRTLQRPSRPHITLAFAPPAALRVSHKQGFNDLIGNSMPRLLDLQNSPELSDDDRGRLAIIEHSGALSMQCFVRDPDDEARGLMVATPRWFTDNQGLSRFYFAVHQSESSELFNALYSAIHTDLRKKEVHRTLDEVAKEYQIV